MVEGSGLENRQAMKHRARVRIPDSAPYADIAQLVEQLICNQQVMGSIPVISSIRSINQIRISGSGVLSRPGYSLFIF